MPYSCWMITASSRLSSPAASRQLAAEPGRSCQTTPAGRDVPTTSTTRTTPPATPSGSDARSDAVNDASPHWVGGYVLRKPNVTMRNPSPSMSGRQPGVPASVLWQQVPPTSAAEESTVVRAAGRAVRVSGTVAIDDSGTSGCPSQAEGATGAYTRPQSGTGGRRRRGLIMAREARNDRPQWTF